jgi:hypothetical protein
VSSGFEEGQRTYSTYHQQCHFANMVRTQINDTCIVRPRNVAADSTNILYQFQENYPIQETKATMPVEFKLRAKEAKGINPSNVGYAQAANRTLKTINFNIKDIKDWAILDIGAIPHFLVTYASATGIHIATNSTTVTIPDVSRLASTHKQELDLPLLPNAAQSGHVIPGMA